MTKTPRLPFGRRLTDITDQRKLTTAETELIEKCRMGQFATFGDKPPETATDGNTIHADLLRFLILGGDDETPVHEQGVQVQGAWIKGDVDLSNAETTVRVACWSCYFAGKLTVRHARLRGLFLNGSRLLGLTGDGLVTQGDMFLKAVKAEGEVRLLGAQIGGDLDCEGGEFLNAGGKALTCDKMTVTGALFLRKGTEIAGTLDLYSAQVGDLIDYLACWPAAGKLVLDGFHYDRFGGATPTADHWSTRRLVDAPAPGSSWQQLPPAAMAAGDQGVARDGP